jgi:hypothetical protein
MGKGLFWLISIPKIDTVFMDAAKFLRVRGCCKVPDVCQWEQRYDCYTKGWRWGGADSIIFRGVDDPCLHSDRAPLAMAEGNIFNSGNRGREGVGVYTERQKGDTLSLC